MAGEFTGALNPRKTVGTDWSVLYIPILTCTSHPNWDDYKFKMAEDEENVNKFFADSDSKADLNGFEQDDL